MLRNPPRSFWIVFQTLFFIWVKLSTTLSIMHFLWLTLGWSFITLYSKWIQIVSSAKVSAAPDIEIFFSVRSAYKVHNFSSSDWLMEGRSGVLGFIDFNGGGSVTGIACQWLTYCSTILLKTRFKKREVAAKTRKSIPEVSMEVPQICPRGHNRWPKPFGRISTPILQILLWGHPWILYWPAWSMK